MTSNPLEFLLFVAGVICAMRGLDAFVFDFKRLIMVRLLHRWTVCPHCSGAGVNLKDRSKRTHENG